MKALVMKSTFIHEIQATERYWYATEDASWLIWVNHLDDSGKTKCMTCRAF